MKLLTATQPAELPADALLARLRCRRAAISQVAGQAAEALAAGSVNWVYQRLNRQLRKQLEPFLELLAMRSLILAIRYTLAGESPPAAVTRNTLLAEPLQQLAATAGEAKTKSAQLEAALTVDYPFAAGLAATYRSQGPGGVEMQLAEGILQHGLARTGSGVIRQTLSYLADMRNCLTILKFWSWQVNREPPLTAGGKLAKTSLLRIWTTHDSERLNRFALRLAGEPPLSTTTVAMEQCLLNGLTRLLRQAGRDPLGLGVIMEYLWRAQLVLHNQLLLQTLGPDHEDMLEEVLLP
jgi:hypothetical protein